MGAFIETLKKYKFILGLMALIVIGFFVYKIFISEPFPEGDQLLTTSGEQSEVEAVTIDLLTLLLSLKTLEIDISIFSDDRFRSLTDFSVELLQQPIGRPNPFLPLDGVPNRVVPISIRTTN